MLSPFSRLTPMRLFFGVAIISLMLLCSCATRNSSHLQLPAEVDMNKDAGRGDELIVTLRLEDGEKLPMMVDTGSPITLFERSMESKLGQRLDAGTFNNFGATQKIGVYAAPKLYLGNILLKNSDAVAFTFDLDIMAGFHGYHEAVSKHEMADVATNWIQAKGVLGMDVLEHYCIQLDFAAGKMRFLDDEHADKKNWGKPFPLTKIGSGLLRGCMTINENLVGVKNSESIIDTGYNVSGWLTHKLFQQWTNQLSAPAKGEMRSHRGVLGGETYQFLDLNGTDEKSVSQNDDGVDFNGIGLGVLSQNLVTLDFPNRMMYLKRTSDFPLVARDWEAKLRLAADLAAKYLMQLKQQNQLPGLFKNDHGTMTDSQMHHTDSPYLDSVVLNGQKNGDSSFYHYTFIRTSQNGQWKLQKAWRTDSDDKVLQEYPVP